MAHDRHFLERLARASLPQAELAMALYHDTELVRELFRQAALPEQVERVAVSLTAEDQGPYAVIARNGRFITCLAQGMRPNPATPILAHTELQRASSRMEQLRTRLQLWQTLDSEQFRVRGLVRRLYNSSEEVCREEIMELVPFQPILATHFVLEALRLNSQMIDLRNDLFRRLKKPMRSENQRDLRTFSDSLWGASHLLALACSGPLEWLSQFDPLLEGREGSLSWGSISSGYVPVMMRAVWAVARMGKHALPQYKIAWAEAMTMKTLLNGGFGLIAIGLRHAKLRAEVLKCFPLPLLPESREAAKLANPLISIFNTLLEMVVKIHEEDEQALRETACFLGSNLLVETCKRFPSVDGAHHYEDPKSVPEELALCQLANMGAVVLNHPEILECVAYALPWVARCRLEELYPPRSFVVSYRCEWTPDHMLEVLGELRRGTYPKVPVRREPTPGRNDPCSCGSGRKYKKCCGAG